YEAVAVLFADLVDSADIRVIESGCGFGLSQQTLFSALIGRDFCWQELNRDFTVEPRVLSQVDHTHPATAQLLDDAVVRDGLTDHLRECYGVRSGMSMYGLTAASHTP